MISDGHNLMLDSREEYRLYLILKNIKDMQGITGDKKDDRIINRWANDLFEAIEKARLHPYEKQTL